MAPLEKPKLGVSVHLPAIVESTFARAFATLPLASAVRHASNVPVAVPFENEERHDPLPRACALATPANVLFAPVMQAVCALLCSWAAVVETITNAAAAAVTE